MTDEYLYGLIPLWYNTSRYENYKKFQKLFEIEAEFHRDSGDSQVFYLQNYEYPVIIDNDKEYLEHLKKHVRRLPFKNIRHAKSWWINYPKHSYTGLHSHQPGKQFTCVLFLDDYIEEENYPHAGYLYAVLNNENQITYEEWKPEVGTLVLMDGRVWHGTYPARHKRRVFVVDFEYDIGEF